MKDIGPSEAEQMRHDCYRRNYTFRASPPKRCVLCKHVVRSEVPWYGTCALLDIEIHDVRRSQCPGFEEATP